MLPELTSDFAIELLFRDDRKNVQAACAKRVDDDGFSERLLRAAEALEASAKDLHKDSGAPVLRVAGFGHSVFLPYRCQKET